MSHSPFSSRTFLLFPAFAAVTSFLLAGCATTGHSDLASPLSTGLSVSGTVHGGQQPVAGSNISLYAAGKSGLYAAPRSMLTKTVTSDTNGAFNISGAYTCQPGDQVYIVASGGNAGGGPNSAIELITALGPCAALTPSTYISINEVTTVASVYALAGFMQSVSALGADYSVTADSNALAASFATVHTLADTVSGAALETSTGNGRVPYLALNSLGNSLAACVNSTSGSSACASLFTDTTVPGSTPANTTQAALNLAHYPATNTASVYDLASPASPFQPTLSSAPASYALVVAHPSDVLTYHNDISRDGVQSAETTLTPANVTSATFGKLHTFSVDSYLFAQPLYVGGIGMPDGIVHNLVFAATTRGSVYAFDADGNNPAAGSLWHVNLIPTAERYPVTNDYGCSNPPEAGIVGTPVIDRASQTLYVVTKSISTAGATFFHRLHAISILDGSERPNSPAVINPVFPGTGAGSTNSSIPFDGQTQNQRSALLLAPNPAGGQTIWISYASHCDIAPYHGDLLGFNAANVTQMTAAFNDTPNGSDGGIWTSSGGPAADAQGNVYTLIGNGTFDANAAGPDYGDSAIKVVPPANTSSTNVAVSDYFTPTNQAYLQQRDLDLGGAEPILVADPSSSGAKSLMIASDKNGSVYLLDTQNLGKYQTGPSSGNGDLQDFTAGGNFIYNFAFFNNVLYTSNPLEAYALDPATPSLSTTPLANTGIANSAPVVSANGSADAIVWSLDPSGILYAYTPQLKQIYSSNQAANGRDTPAPVVKFTSPVIANGKVYLSGNGALVVYGQLP